MSDRSFRPPNATDIGWPRTGRQAQESQLDKTLAVLLHLARDNAASVVRRAALDSLATAMLQMPAVRLAAHKADVLKCLNAAVDDRKRVVRQVAVQMQTSLERCSVAPLW